MPLANNSGSYIALNRAVRRTSFRVHLLAHTHRCSLAAPAATTCFADHALKTDGPSLIRRLGTHDRSVNVHAPLQYITTRMMPIVYHHLSCPQYRRHWCSLFPSTWERTERAVSETASHRVKRAQFTFCSAVLARLPLAVDHQARFRQQQQQHRLRRPTEHEHRCSLKAFRRAGRGPLQDPVHLPILSQVLEPSLHVAADMEKGSGVDIAHVRTCKRLQASTSTSWQSSRYFSISAAALATSASIGRSPVILTAFADRRTAGMRSFSRSTQNSRASSIISAYGPSITYHRVLGCLQWLGSFTKSNACHDNECRDYQMMY